MLTKTRGSGTDAARRYFSSIEALDVTVSLANATALFDRVRRLSTISSE
ncbi:MAG: hypothetical protein J7641_13580 [Cyanobacteria bacterium SID2]|nr:hypothetical protein [Cyanobacteria bacterium SID2]MBP0004466.1 hypothetical protein [Cyanobacteria bacterium SBC]